jgi:ArsR family transcriptional regulator
MAIDARSFELIAKALAEPKRVEILTLISQQPGITCNEVVKSIGLSQPTISHHLKELCEAGLITGEKDGQFVRLTAAPTALRAFVDSLAPITNS